MKRLRSARGESNVYQPEATWQQILGGPISLSYLALLSRSLYDDGASSANSHAEQSVFNSGVAVTPTNSD